MTIQKTIRKTRLEVQKRLSAGHAGPEMVARTMSYLTARYSETLKTMPGRVVWDCRKGCSFCCYNPVGVVGLEALKMAQDLSARLGPQDKKSVIAGLKILDADARAKSWDELFNEQRECMFLVERRFCGIYKVRPFGCRSLFSSSSEACAQAFETRTFKAPFDQQPVAALGAIVAGFSLAFRDLRLPLGRYELHSALACALETPDADRRWLSGEDIFQDCVPDGSFDENSQLWFLDNLETIIPG